MRIFITLLFGFSLCACAEPTWTPISSPEAGFTAEMLGTPQKTSGVVKQQGNIMNAAMVEVTETRFVANARPSGASLETEILAISYRLKVGGDWWVLNEGNIDKGLWESIDGGMTAIGAKRVAERQEEIGGQIAKEVEYSGNGSTHLVRVARHGQNQYMMRASYGANQDTQIPRNRFFRSFRFTS